MRNPALVLKERLISLTFNSSRGALAIIIILSLYVAMRVGSLYFRVVPSLFVIFISKVQRLAKISNKNVRVCQEAIEIDARLLSYCTVWTGSVACLLQVQHESTH